MSYLRDLWCSLTAQCAHRWTLADPHTIEASNITDPPRYHASLQFCMRCGEVRGRGLIRHVMTKDRGYIEVWPGDPR